MTRILILILLGGSLLFSSCKKDDEITYYASNLSGESFNTITRENNVELIIRVKRRLGYADIQYIFNRYSFPGNNFISVWTKYSSGGTSTAENYNLEKIIWYKIENKEYQNGDVKKALYFEIEGL